MIESKEVLALRGGHTSITEAAPMCPRTIDLLGRAVMLPITQIMTDAYVDEVIGAIQKVARNW
jgi:hypothetical protein